MRGSLAFAAALLLPLHARGEARVVASQATVSGSYQSQQIQAASNVVIAAIQPAERREEARQGPAKDTDSGTARRPARVPAAKRTR